MKLIFLECRENEVFPPHSESGPTMRTFTLPQGWPVFQVSLSDSVATIRVGKDVITVTSLGDPRTLRGRVPGVLGWAELRRSTGFTCPVNQPTLFVHFEYISLDLDTFYQRRTAVLEVPLEGSGGMLGFFNETTPSAV